ncbi:MAG: VIT and VWA domain-containing protein [Desulfovibrio sp.]|jgi:Ca-activated chloride channel family protein|nr:VIT and VWA domain-containing protein [Desulfovibrio sp.]
MAQEAVLKSSEGECVALQSVRVAGKLEGLLLETDIQQNYLNDTGKNLEIVYTFPLAWGARLLDMEAEIGGRRLQGAVFEKKQAEENYEKAIDQGDTPIMVQEASPGLYTANLGNIKPGESVRLTMRCAQLLCFEQGRIRVKIPTVIAPRYGDEHREGGLAPHETTDVDLTAQYPLTVQLDVCGESAQARISSPSHAVNVSSTEKGVRVLLESGAMLDRDFIVLLEGLDGHSFALAAKDGDEHMLLASFCPKLPEQADPLLLKILVDCSGSMAGDSIQEAKRALHAVLQELKEGDFVSFSRFGSMVQHQNQFLQPCSDSVLQALSGAVAETEADMGGTEMEQALRSTLKDVALPQGISYSPCVLLITDDLVWDSEGIQQVVLKSGHHIFAVGVGSAPAETLLRRITEATGGACEFATPNEDVAGTIVRMFRRMRVAQNTTFRMNWGGETLWQSPLPKAIFDGETVHLFARVAQIPAVPPELTWEAGERTEHARPESIGRTENQSLTRLGGARRMEGANDADALALALRYQLVSRLTSLFLCYLRDDEDKLTELPEVRQVPQMLAAGYGGAGSVFACSFYPTEASLACDSLRACLSVQRPADPTEASLACDSLPDDIGESPMLPYPPITSPKTLLARFDALKPGVSKKEAVDWLRKDLDASVEERMNELAQREGIADETALALLLDWLCQKFAGDYQLTKQAARLLRKWMKPVEPARRSAIQAGFDELFPAITLDSWGLELDSWEVEIPF